MLAFSTTRLAFRASKVDISRKNRADASLYGAVRDAVAVLHVHMHHLSSDCTDKPPGLVWWAVLAHARCLRSCIGCNNVAMLLDRYGLANQRCVTLLLYLQVPLRVITSECICTRPRVTEVELCRQIAETAYSRISRLSGHATEIAIIRDS